MLITRSISKSCPRAYTSDCDGGNVRNTWWHLGARTARGSATLPVNPARLGLRPTISVLQPIVSR